MDKATLLAEAITDLPQEIQDKLNTVIPALTATTDPTSDENQNILAHNLNTIFKTCLEGVPLLAIPLFIGQLNTVNQGLLVAALELVQQSGGGAGGFEIVNPTDGKAYLPGDVRFQVRPTGGAKIQQAAVDIDGGDPVPLQWDDQGFFWGFARLETEQTYSATVAVLYADDKSDAGTGDTEEQTVSFSISSEADAPGEGGDFGPVEYALDGLKDSAEKATEGIQQELPETTGLINDVIAYARKFVATTWQEVEDETREAWQRTKEDLETLSGLINDLTLAKGARSLTPEDQVVITIIGDITTQAETVYSEAAQAWFEANPHPPTGYATSPKVLSGAAKAMNEKYGPGTVWYEGL